jgi:hypothetical protein
MEDCERMKSLREKVVFAVEIGNIFVFLMSGIFVPVSMWGIVALVSIFLCFHSLKERKWAFTLLRMQLLAGSFLGVLGIITTVGYIYRNLDPTPCVFMAIVGTASFIAWVILQKEK